jgi:hypothetical protein
MSSRIITGATVGEALEPRLTVDGLRNLLLDLRTAGKPLPRAILVSEYDRRELNQDLMAGSTVNVSKHDQREDADGAAIGVVEGVIIKAHPHVERGKARLIYGPPPPPEPAKLGGEGLIIVGA